MTRWVLSLAWLLCCVPVQDTRISHSAFLQQKLYMGTVELSEKPDKTLWGSSGEGGSPRWAIIPFWGYSQYLCLLYATATTISFDSQGTKHESRFHPYYSKGITNVTSSLFSRGIEFETISL